MIAHGFPDSDLDVLEPTLVQRAAAELARRRTVLDRVAALLGDEGYFADQSLQLVRAGHPIVLVHAPDEQALRRARPVLGSNAVLLARHYGEMTVTDL